MYQTSAYFFNNYFIFLLLVEKKGASPLLAYLLIILLYLCWQPVGLGKIAKLINEGKIDSHELITMKTLKVQ